MFKLVSSTKGIAHALIWPMFIATIVSCSEDADQEKTAKFNEQSLSCLECHDITLDAAHLIDCEQCHQFVDKPGTSAEDHPSILLQPSHPDVADLTCGQCHDNEAAMVKTNDHYLLTDHIEMVLGAFSNNPKLKTPETTLPNTVSAHQSPESISELAEDMLSRRCLRCHVYGSGDQFSQVLHGTGCAACHLEYSDMKLVSHRFNAKPTDDRCLSCHYGNHVGFDYYGRYEHDLNEEYRTPYYVNDSKIPPFGVEYHQLAADIHQVAGMVCIDCHTQNEVMGNSSTLSCNDCHDYHPDKPTGLHISTEDKTITLQSADTGRTYRIPQLDHPVHDQYGDRFSCQVCHAQWSFNDGSSHLLRIDHEEFDDFYKLSVDGSYEVHQIIASHIDYDGDLLEPFMTNKFTGKTLPGIWFRGFVERRWERMLLTEDTDGKITTARPILDLHVSWIDWDEEVRFDNIRPETPVLRSYAPHTIGKAGLFYQTRIGPYLDN